MTDAKVSVSADDFLASDKQLTENAEFKELHKKYSQPAADEVVARAVKALEDKGHKASVVANSEELLKLVDSLITKPDSSVWVGGSTTLNQLGLIDYLKSKTELDNLKAQYLEAMGKSDFAGVGAAAAKSWTADFWFTSVGAVSETGDFVWGSLTGTRLALSAKNLVIITGTNKITQDYDAAVERLYKYQKPLEDARARVAYGVPASTIAEFGAVRAANPYNKNVHIIFVKGSYGF